MLWAKAFHIIAMVAWFAGIFYLPRLFVYHSECKDIVSHERFIIMERRLYYAITWPAAILTTLLGVHLVFYAPSVYFNVAWFHVKIFLVLLLWGYHLSLGSFLRKFKKGVNQRSSKFFRIYNEVPTLLLIFIVILVVVKPTL
jgi:putative membrane protein